MSETLGSISKKMLAAIAPNLTEKALDSIAEIIDENTAMKAQIVDNELAIKNLEDLVRRLIKLIDSIMIPGYAEQEVSEIFNQIKKNQAN